MKEVKITCDGCGRDLTRTSNCVDYRLSLEPENITTRGGFVTAMGKYPALNRGHHFCDLACLDHWSDRRHHRNKLSLEWSDAHCTVRSIGDGVKVHSYPPETEEEREKRYAGFDAAALSAFPMERPKR